jgi:hypothetical protein
MVAFCVEVTVVLVIVKVAETAPADTTTLPGTVAAGLLLDRVTLAPPAGAGPFIVTVPVAVALPKTVLGSRTSE